MATINLDSLINNSTTIKKEKFKSDAMHSSVIDKISVFFEYQLFSDVTLIDKDQTIEINAHKMVLAAASKYFLTMFGGSSGESSEEVLTFHELDAQALKSVITFIYTASIELASDTVKEILRAALFFELDSLKSLCLAFIVKHLETSNCLGMVTFAEQHDMEELFKISEDFVIENFSAVRKEKEFFDLDVEHLSKYLSSNNLQIESEEDVFECIMSWINHNKENREQFIDNLLHNVRLSQVKPTFIANSIEPACKTLDSVTQINKALKWHLLPDMRSSMSLDAPTERRHSLRTLFAISGWNDGCKETVLKVGSFNFQTNQWIYSTWPAPPVRRFAFGSTVGDGKLVIAGGYRNLGNKVFMNRVDSFDLETLEWTNLVPMLAKRHEFGMATLNGCVYAFGGNDKVYNCFERSRSKSMEKWNPKTKNWTFVCEDLSQSIGRYLTNYKTTLCGAAEKTNPNQMEYHIYDTSSGTWNEHWLQSTADHIGFGTVRFEGKELFIIIWRNSILKHDLEDDSKISIPIDRIEDEFTKCEMFADHIIIFGEKKFKMYYPFTDEWKTMPDLDNELGRVILVTNY